MFVTGYSHISICERKLSDVLETLCKIVEFIYNFCSYITFCHQRDGKKAA